MPTPAKRPCGSCPYRRDVPSGVWTAEEYAKLPRYDNETPYQPPALFFCHQQDGHLCAGWVGCHDMEESLALRIHASRMSEAEVDEILHYQSPVPLFASGAEAAAHGAAGIKNPDERARRTIARLTRKVAR